MVLVVAPLPKLQNRFVMPPEEVSVNATVRGELPIVGDALKAAEGGWD